MSDYTLAKVMLYIDGTVHICLQDYRTFYASANALKLFFADPINYIKDGIQQQKESTLSINKSRKPLDKMAGITLAYLTGNKQIICNFPELFQFIYSTPEDSADKILDMQAYATERTLSDGKSFLLKYYLDFVKTFSGGTTIQNRLDISEEALFSTMREIFNTAFEIEPVKPPKKDLRDRVNDARHRQLFDSTLAENSDNMIPVTEYAVMHGVAHQAVLAQIHSGKLKTAYKTKSNRYLIDKNEPFIASRSKLKAAKITDNSSVESAFFNAPDDWPAARVEKYITDKKLFSPIVARYVYSKEELDYYVNARYIEVEWNGHRALIKDVDPNYTTRDGVSNRERMRKGKPPVVPEENKDDKIFEIHHLGQKDEVFVTLESYIHRSKGYTNIFHASAPSEDLHTSVFEVEKVAFWKRYIEEYDKAGEFSKIPYEFPVKHRAR